MVNIPLGRGDYFRNVAKEARIRIRNRYFEENPILNPQNTAMMAAWVQQWQIGGSGSNWILALGTWNDAGIWEDSAVWID